MAERHSCAAEVLDLTAQWAELLVPGGLSDRYGHAATKPATALG
ncbi:hypothetical protein [Nocardia sp. NBC_01009]|nr:hypothetical protein OHA42_12165 [Nocardia sp. NBC_01009]